jgi:hypothetical protein
LQSDSNSEIEDLMDPKDEVKKKIVTLASTIRKWNADTLETRKSVRTQLKDILDLGLNKYKMQKIEVRKLVEEIFLYHGISESWLRKLLPEGLKDTSKTRLSYLQKQKIVEERQRLLLQLNFPFLLLFYIRVIRQEISLFDSQPCTTRNTVLVSSSNEHTYKRRQTLLFYHLNTVLTLPINDICY